MGEEEVAWSRRCVYIIYSRKRRRRRRERVGKIELGCTVGI